MQKPQTGLASPPCRTPPGQSAGTRQTHPGIMGTPRFRCHLCQFSTRQQRFARARLPDPHLTRHRGLFHIAHHGRVTAPAACGGLKPPPAGRLRRADNPSSPAQHRFSKLYLHRTPLHVRDTHPRLQAPRHHHPVRRTERVDRHGDRAMHAAPPSSGVVEVPQDHRPRGAQRPGDPPDPGQLRHPQTPRRRASGWTIILGSTCISPRRPHPG